MPGYTTDLHATVDLPGVPVLPAGGTRLALPVKNVGATRYAANRAPFYPDQVFFGAPRTVEPNVSFMFQPDSQGDPF